MTINTSKKNIIFTLESVGRSFRSSEGQELKVVNDINFTMYENEIVAIVGKSGSGKSTLMRMIAGLIPPSSGEVIYRGKPVDKPVKGISMVFQTFALMPWLTVLENVELGLEALGIPSKERRKRALKAIDTIGLDGFESAYPKELSGGMCQRVGFARAIVVEPELLLMDEPFSALDVLTSDNLRSDLLDLWLEKQTRTKGILFVTHSIEEAALMADRIIIFGSNPGHISAELTVNLPLPRNTQQPRIRELVDEIYTLMTTSDSEKRFKRGDARAEQQKIDATYRLPNAGVNELMGLIDAIVKINKDDPIDLPILADELMLETDQLFPLIEAMEILKLATVSKGDITLTPFGKQFYETDILERKQLFANQFMAHVPIAQHIRKILDERPFHKESENFFLAELEEHLTENEAARVFKTIIDWGRYAEIFSYDYDSGMFSLENPK